jgi:hypothetical protein
MQTRAASITPVSDVAASKSRPARLILVLLTVVALVSVGAAAARIPRTTVDPDLVRVIRFMALIKGGLALSAFLGSYWRLARPAALWRTSIYVAGPSLIAAGAIGLWSLHYLGVAALGLHLGLLVLLAAVLTDPDFLPDPSLRRRRRQ